MCLKSITVTKYGTENIVNGLEIAEDMQRKRCPKYILTSNNLNKARCYIRYDIYDIYFHYRQQKVPESIDLQLYPIYLMSSQQWKLDCCMHSLDSDYGFCELIFYVHVFQQQIIRYQDFLTGKTLIYSILQI